MKPGKLFFRDLFYAARVYAVTCVFVAFVAICLIALA
jgi:hypothetical protein